MGCRWGSFRDIFLSVASGEFCGDEEDGSNQIEIETRDRPTLRWARRLQLADIKGGENGLLPFLFGSYGGRRFSARLAPELP